MAMMTLRDIPDELHSALKARAKRNNRSLVAEVRNILKEVLQPEDRVLMGDALVDIGREMSLTDEEVNLLEQNQDKVLAEPVRFE
ncbi:MAG: plasmid stabilization protein [Endozoicomonas sp. (ex Botrylloides leachii)]|nr:plasmid stabilization protein [Endozoicomonas sp. (ex Botrylloides leachii)]